MEVLNEAGRKFGLNKVARLRAERAAEGEVLAAVVLQPDWPYEQVGWDPGFFGVAVDPPSP